MNCLDIYLDQIKYPESETQEQGIRFLTLDFYNHDSQYSHMISSSQIHLQVGFKVNVDDFLLEYMETQGVKVELFECSNASSTLLATGTIPLHPLL